MQLNALYQHADPSKSPVDLLALQELPYPSPQRLDLERSQIYLGYKILWSLSLFITGKKFPSGNIREARWKAYVLDIAEMITNK